MSKIKVPEGMGLAAQEAYGPLVGGPQLLRALEAALLWLSENPIAPTKEQMRELVSIAPCSQARQEYSATIFCMEEWQRRMFLEPEPESYESFDDIEFESWWASTNNKNWFSNKPIDLRELKRSSYFSWRAGKELEAFRAQKAGSK